MYKLKKIKVTIEGVSPLLMQNIENVDLTGGGMRLRTKKHDPKKEAEKLAYWVKKKGKRELCVPARCIYAMMTKAGAFIRIGGRYASSLIAGAMTIEPERISLGTDKYDIDTRPVVIQKQRVLKSRAKISPWKLSFVIKYDSNFIESDALKKVLEIAGMRIGLLDYRPANKGPFGKFKIIKWQAS